MENLADRKRSFDINKLSAEAADQLSQSLGAKVREICDKACEEANKILNVYSMKAQMQIVIQGINEAPKAPQQQEKKKRGRPRKDSQSLS